MKKNILAENMRRFGTKNLTNSQKSRLNENEGPLPKDNIIKIDGSEPYVTVTYNDNGNTVVIKFDDYELHDRVNANVWVGTIEGTDNKNQAWQVDAEAVELGGGDYDWEIDWDTIDKINKL